MQIVMAGWLTKISWRSHLIVLPDEEGQEGRNAYVEKRPPDFGKFVRHP